ncbi:conserved hypothetical protein [Phenylobacterium zucineum HLK1]|uniref:DUF1778 domain-containing protein n=2 Tax=Phenylobacterium zucineum TaxID=284016 RepID=B4RER4_PHEZH|nr:conserved hypothetical protein [Phenylobacterium zucineum HLK1]
MSISIPAAARRPDLIDRAAETVGKTRSEFMLQTACKEAEAVLPDRRCFTLEDAQFQAFLARLDEARPSDRLVELLNTKAPWET